MTIATVEPFGPSSVRSVPDAPYALAWSVFVVGFAAVFWLQNRVSAAMSLGSLARVVLPATLLGIAVTRISERDSLGNRLPQ